MRIVRILAVAAVLATSAVARAELIYAIGVPTTTSTSLLKFDSATPATITTVGAITGIVTGQTLRGIDFRPANGQLYAISSNGTAAQIYTVDLATGVATPVGSGITLTGNTSTRISIDFNPVVDRIRVVTGSGQSYRVNPNTGAIVAQDADIVTGGSGAIPLISGIAYSENYAGATQTTLYAYDFLLDNLGSIGGINGIPSPNGGTFSIIGNSGIVTGDAGLGFDISGATGIGYISVDDFQGSPGFNAEFFTVNLATGVLSQVNGDDFASILDISVLPAARVPEPTTLSLALLAVLGLVSTRRQMRPSRGRQ